MCKALSPSPLVSAADLWPATGDFKNYPHFDWPISRQNITKLVTNRDDVARNSFYPFIQYTIKYKRFGGKGADGKPIKREPKKRIIRYAARRDAYIYAYYRRLLMVPYEQLLKDNNINECVIAYRKIPVHAGSDAGKNNIHFANEAFDEISRRGDCFAIAMDISSFFENLDHALLEKRWAQILGIQNLEKDHAAVCRAITKYSFVDRDACYKKLGYIKCEKIGEKEVWTKEKKIPVKLCNRKDFVKHIVGTEKDTLIQKNKERGIPQGSPISDVLANLYLFEFDIAVKQYADSIGAYYRRYSDDILLICPNDKKVLDKLTGFVADEIKKAGEHITIKPEKTNATEFLRKGDSQICKTMKIKLEDAEKPFEYLGFSFDGKRRLIRNTTMSNFYRKVAASCHAYANELVTRYPKKSFEEVFERANLPRFLERFGKVEEFEEKCIGEPTKWTFLTYAKRAEAIIGDKRIMQQVAKRNKVIEHRLKYAIHKRLGKN